MKRLAFLIIFFVMTPGIMLKAQNNCIPVYSTAEKELAYQAGEYAEYMLHYKYGIINTDVATASVKLDSVLMGGIRAFHCRVFGSTYGIYKKLFNVTEDFQSWFTVDGVRPLRFYRNTEEGSYKSINNYTYMWDAQEPYIDASVYTSRADSTRTLQIPLKQCTFDLPSLYYFARNIDLSKIQQDVKYPMTFAIDDEKYDVYYIYKGREVKNISGMGKVRCLHFQAKLIAGEVFKGDHDMDIYISDDRNRVPLLFTADIIVGQASGRLIKCGGLKYPQSFKLK